MTVKFYGIRDDWKFSYHNVKYIHTASPDSICLLFYNSDVKLVSRSEYYWYEVFQEDVED